MRNLDSLKCKIPWWNDLSADTAGTLALDPFTSLGSKSLTVDLAIIGGGVTGLSAAAHAAESGLEVILLEAEEFLGGGATGRNAGILSAGINMPLAKTPAGSPEQILWKQTADICQELFFEGKKPDTVLQISKTGSFCLATSAAAAGRLKLEAKDRQAIGLKAELITLEEARQKTGERLNLRNVKSVLHFPDEGRIQPLSLLSHLASKARKHGASLLGKCRIESYKKQSDLWELKSATGEILRASTIIKASGPCIKPTARIYALAFALDLPAGFPLFWDANPYTYYDYRPGQGRLTVSGGPYGKINSDAKDSLYHARMIRQTTAWMPELEGASPLKTWAVNLNINAQTVPEMLPLDNEGTGFSIEGLGALGVLSGIVLSRQAVDRLNSGVFSRIKPARLRQ